MSPITGFVDEMVKKGGLILLAARPGIGKSTLAFNIAGNMSIDCRRRVAFFCIETGGALSAQSLVCSRAHVKVSALRNNKMTSAEKDRIAATSRIIRDAPLFVDEHCDWNIAELVDTVREMNKEKKLDLVIVDYLQLVMSDKGETREEKLENVVRELKALAYELRIPIIVTATTSWVPATRNWKNYTKSALPHSRRILSGFWTGAIRARTGTRTSVRPNSMWRIRKFF